jgi:hypothetical protein
MGEEHARRNLLLAASAVLLSVWLGSPVGVLARHLLAGAEAQPLSPFRVWVAVAAVLLYLAHRYQHSGEFRQAQVDYVRDLVGARSVRVRAAAWRAVCDAAGWRGSTAILPGEDGAGDFKELNRKYQLTGASARTFKPVPGSLGPVSANTWKFSAKVDLIGTHPNGTMTPVAGHMLSFDLSARRYRWRLSALSALAVCTGTSALTTMVLPYGLALMAMAVSTYKAASAW